MRGTLRGWYWLYTPRVRSGSSSRLPGCTERCGTDPPIPLRSPLTADGIAACQNRGLLTKRAGFRVGISWGIGACALSARAGKGSPLQPHVGSTPSRLRPMIVGHETRLPTRLSEVDQRSFPIHPPTARWRCRSGHPTVASDPCAAEPVDRCAVTVGNAFWFEIFRLTTVDPRGAMEWAS